MIKFNSAANWFRRGGLGLYLCNLFVFVVCLPLFHMGTWIQVEPTMLVMFITSFLGCIWLTIGLAKKWLVIEPPVHPLITILCCWAGWQILTAAFADNPLISWLGPPQQGEGAAFHVMLVLTVFLGMPLWGEECYRKKLLTAAAISVCIMAFLHFDTRMIYDPMANTDDAYNFYHESNPYTPFNWPHYLAFIVSWLWIAYASSPATRSRVRDAVFIVIFIVVLAISNNKTAYLLLFSMFLGAGFVLLLQNSNKRQSWLEPVKAWKILAVLGIVLPLGWIVASQYYNFGETAYVYKDAKKHIAGCKTEYMLLCKHIDLTERAVFNKVVWDSLKDDPYSIVFGKGWGSFASDLFKYDMLDGLHSYVDGIYSPNLENISGFVKNNYDFHSHNQSASALHSSGVVGLLLFTAIPLVAILYLDSALFWWCVPVLLGVNAVGSFWFFVPQVMPFQALGLIALISGRASVRQKEQTISPRFVLAPAIIMCLLAASVVAQGDAIIYGVTFWQLKFAKVTPEHPDNIEWMKEDINRGGVRLLFYSIDYLEKLTEKIAAGTATKNDRDWYRDFLNASRYMGTSPQATAFLRILEPEFSMRLLFAFKTPSPLDELKSEVSGNIVASIVRISESAPQREDFIAPFLINLGSFTGNDIAKQRSILEQILAVAPQHRSALWLLGGIYENIPSLRDKGIAMKKQAALLGVDRVYPVTRQEVSTIN